MKQSFDEMGWNAPGSDPSNNNNDNGNKQNQWGQNNNHDPWGREKKNTRAFDLERFLSELKKALFGKGKSSSGNNSAGGKSSLGVLTTVVIVVLLGIYIFAGFYTVREAERGVVLRFGKMYSLVDPGLRWKFTGIDTVNIIDIEQVRAIRSSGTMLTQDENVVNVEMDVQYRISDPVKYLYSLTNPDQTLLEATDSALRYVVGHTLMDDILTSGREMVRQNTRELLTSIIEPYNTGLSIVEVNFLPARPPEEVKAAFDDAIAAQEDEQRYKREAEAYANEVLPRADGRVQRITQEAEAYRSQVVLDAQGEVARFEKVLPEYQQAPDITRTRIYLETMQQVLGASQKVIIDTKNNSNGPLLYMPMPAGINAQPQVQKDDSDKSNSYTVPLQDNSSTQDNNSAADTTTRTGGSYPPLSSYGQSRR